MGADQLACAAIDDALAGGLGSAAALSIGVGGRERVRYVAGRTWRAEAASALGGEYEKIARSSELDRAASPNGDAEVVDAHTRFDVASLTKPMATAALAMALVGDGALALADPIRRWLPHAASDGTVAHLLGHAAGYPAHVELWNRGVRTREALFAQAASEPCTPAGERAVYSDLGYITLGAVIERAADRPLEVAYRERIGERIGIAARFVRADEAALAPCVATEHDRRDGRGWVCGRVHDENAYFGGGVAGHAGLFASIDDVARFAAAILASSIWRPDVVAAFTRTASAPDTSWRLGWDTPAIAPGVSHAGDRWPRATGFGHLGFTGTSLWLDPASERWCALLTNRVHPSRDGTAEAVKALRRTIGDLAMQL